MDDILIRLDKMSNAIPEYAKAKSDRVYIENFLRCKKATLMQQCKDSTISAKEMYAYAHDEYKQLIEGLKDSVYVEEKCKWALEKLKMDIEVWRTQQANDRYLKDKL